MKFKSKGQPLNDDGFDQTCEKLGVPESVLWAILTVETRGFGFFHDRSPQILFERHVFHRLTDGKYDHGNDGISSKHPGGYVGGISEYKRLKKAIKLNEEAALQSASWGIAQIMGFNHKIAGFDDIFSFVKDMVRDENRQLFAMASFIDGNGLAGALRRRNWISFARRYNGPSFKKNEYDTRLAAAFAKFQVILPDLELRTAQVALQYLGYNPGPIDGIRGRNTRSALISFQEDEELAVTGELDMETKRRLNNKVAMN